MEQDFTRNLEILLVEDRIPFRMTNEEAKAQVMERISVNDGVIQLNSHRNKRFIAAAAAAVIFITALWGFADYQEIDNRKSDILRHELPDGSEVFLKTEADLAYHPWEWRLNRRNLEFEGTGFFEVEEGSKFTVETPSGDVSVLGTSFSLVTGKNRLKVSCKTGKVLVTTDDGIQKILLPGEGIDISKSEIDFFEVEEKDIDRWIEGTYEFDGARVGRVLNVLEDLTGMDIDYSAQSELEFTGFLRADDSIEDLLNIVCKPLDLDYEIIESEQIIRIK